MIHPQAVQNGTMLLVPLSAEFIMCTTVPYPSGWQCPEHCSTLSSIVGPTLHAYVAMTRFLCKEEATPFGALFQLRLVLICTYDVLQVFQQPCIVRTLSYWLHHTDLLHLALHTWHV